MGLKICMLGMLSVLTVVGVNAFAQGSPAPSVSTKPASSLVSTEKLDRAISQKNDQLIYLRDLEGLTATQRFPSLGLSQNRDSARSTMVVVPAEGANDLLGAQTRAITSLSGRLQIIEDRLERLERNKEKSK